MGKQSAKTSSKTQSILKIGVGSKWEKISKKKDGKRNEILNTIPEEEEEDNVTIQEELHTQDEESTTKQVTEPSGDVNEDTPERQDEVLKLIVTKKKYLSDEEEEPED